MEEQKPEGRTRKRWSIPPGKRAPTLGRSPEVQRLLDDLGFKEVKGRPNEGQALIFENPKQPATKRNNKGKEPEQSNSSSESQPPNREE